MPTFSRTAQASDAKSQRLRLLDPRFARRSGVWLALCAVAGALAATSPLFAANANPLIGKWRSADRGGVTEFYVCGRAVCGRILDGASLRANPDLRDVKNGDNSLRTRRVKGLTVMSNFTGGPAEWRGGPLYDPERGMGVARGTIKLVDANTLKITGCFAKFICQSEILKRIP